MATGRLASGSIAAGGATQLYRNSTGNAQVITLLASSQVSGVSPKLNVKITNENFTETTSVTTVVNGVNQTLTTAYPALTAQLVGGNSNSYSSDVTNSGSQIHLSITPKETSNLMGQAFSKGYTALGSNAYSHPWSAVSFGGQPMCIGGGDGGNHRFDDNDRYHSRANMPQYDPYYFENPNAFNQKKARGYVFGSDGNPCYHIEDISKMPFSQLRKWYNPYSANGENDYYTNTAPTTDAATIGTVTSRNISSSYNRRGHYVDLWTGLVLSLQNNGYHAMMWIDENSPSTASDHMADFSSNGGIWKWSYNNWQGNDPAGYDDDGHGSVYGCYADLDHGLVCAHSGTYSGHGRIGFKFFEKFFDGNMNDKDNRSRAVAMSTYASSTYYHTVEYSSTHRYQKLQWVKYNPNTDKYYVCFWDNSGNFQDNPPSMGTSYPAESGIFEVDVTEIYGHSSDKGNSHDESFSQAITDGVLTKVASVPDTVSGFMSKPMRLSASLWTAHCQDGKHYFSNNLYTWAEKSSTYIPDAYQMVNTKGSGTVPYYVASDSTSVVYTYSETVSTDVYDQAAAAGIIAQGAVTPYEQKAIILSDGDAIYVENEDATNAISVTAMGVDV